MIDAVSRHGESVPLSAQLAPAVPHIVASHLQVKEIEGVESKIDDGVAMAARRAYYRRQPETMQGVEWPADI